MSDANPTGLFSILKRLGDLAVGAAQSRVELFAVELKEEKCRLIHTIILTAVAIALGATTLTLLTITLIVLFWENGRVPALCVLSGLYVIATVVAVHHLRKSLAGGAGFSGTLGELKKDRACLQSKN